MDVARRMGYLMACLVVAVLAAGCELLGTTDTFEDFAGTYEATTFVVAGPADGAVDVLAQGGRLVMHLHADGDVEGEVVYSSLSILDDTTFAGRYVVVRDTLVLSGVQSVPITKLAWDRSEHTLRVPPSNGRTWLYDLVLVKRQE